MEGRLIIENMDGTLFCGARASLPLRTPTVGRRALWGVRPVARRGADPLRFVRRIVHVRRCARAVPPFHPPISIHPPNYPSPRRAQSRA